MMRGPSTSLAVLRREFRKSYPATTSSFSFQSCLFSTDEKTTDDMNSPVFYEAPMGALISRLKKVSITSCALSIVGLPLLVYIKNGDIPNMKQLGMGGVAFFGATGSTIALHFVFGPYALTMEKVSPKVEESADGDQEATLIKATTRSVFGWTNETIFDPLKDVTPYKGARPFANFVANDVVLYAHPELLDEEMRQRLLFPGGSPVKEEEGSIEKNEGLKAKKKMDEEDDLF
eukprot:scaffold22640_cov138-Cylindrotheca_fusiformis.AAC.7